MGHKPIHFAATGATGPAEPAFDHNNPPDAALVDDCVHCGFCLPTCPTYRLWGEEMDSPRGRIHLIKTGLEGAPLTDAMVGHIDACLGCMACLTACPSGVHYDELLEATRGQIERRYPRSRADRALREAIFALFPYPRRLLLTRGPLHLAQRMGLDRAASTVLNRLAPQLAALTRLAPRLGDAGALPTRVAALGTPRAEVIMLTGCVQSVFFPGVNAATARVLAAEGCEVRIPAGQGCCGALSGHAGRREEARRFARDLIDTFAGDVPTIVNAAGCGSAMKEYGRLLADDPAYAARAQAFSARVRDLAEFLTEIGPVAPRRRLPLVAAYHDACHLGHAQRVRSQPRELLRGIPELELRELADAEICCGSAGIYNILNPEPAAELGAAKAAAVLASGAELLVTANPGCLLQIAAAVEQAGGQVQLAHTAQVLDAAINGTPLR